MKLHFAAFRAPGARVFQSERPAAAVALAGGDVQGRRSAERCGVARRRPCRLFSYASQDHWGDAAVRHRASALKTAAFESDLRCYGSDHDLL